MRPRQGNLIESQFIMMQIGAIVVDLIVIAAASMRKEVYVAKRSASHAISE